MLTTNSKYRKIALSLAIMVFGSPAMAANTHCGPGPHWIDDCPGAIDVVPVKLKLYIRTPCNDMTAAPVTVTGPIKVKRENGVPGIPAMAGLQGNTAHVIDYEVITFKASGHGITLRGGKEQGVIPSYGRMTERADEPTVADKVADYFFTLDTPIGRLHMKETCRMKGWADKVPPPASIVLKYDTHPCSNTIANKLYDDEEQEVGCLLLGEPEPTDQLYYFSAEASDGQITLRWETDPNIGSAGFHIWRALKNDAGEYVDIVQVTEQPVLSQGNSMSGASYLYVDSEGIFGNTYYYAIEEAEGTYLTEFLVSATVY
ncbi:MAG: hypothetical protein DRR19_00030 [Candidatus Parabeggiatoa sp. nov. 1]|nr:MAG: hypothetical protein DRR19_00030 [Gammaproteobacteria bacterium]